MDDLQLLEEGPEMLITTLKTTRILLNLLTPGFY